MPSKKVYGGNKMDEETAGTPTPAPQNEMIAGIESFVSKFKSVLDVNHDGIVNAADLKTAFLNAGAFLYHYLSAVVKDVAPELPGLALEAATVSLTTTGDKRTAQLNNIVQTLADDAVHAAVAEGTDAAVAIGDKYGIPGTIVSALVGSAYDMAKAA
jgi:hypothetical protein